MSTFKEKTTKYSSFVNNKNIIFDNKDSSSPSFFPVTNLDQPCCPVKADLYFHFN